MVLELQRALQLQDEIIEVPGTPETAGNLDLFTSSSLNMLPDVPT